MNHEIASDSLIHQPMEPAVGEMLVNQHGFSPTELARGQNHDRALLSLKLGQLGVMLDMSRPTALEPVVGVHDDTPTYQPASFEAIYDEVRRNANHKFAFDSQTVGDFLTLLGPTNRLRSKEGLDAGFDLAALARLLKTDYEALSHKKQQPEKRMVEGVLSEELALLWHSDTPKRFAKRSDQAFMFDLEDPNIFTRQQMHTLEPADRWKLIGVRLSNSVADVFDAIAASQTATLSQRLEARCRATDMRIRGLQIQASMNIGDAKRQQLFDKIAGQNTDFMGELAAIWEHPSNHELLRWGRFFELFVVAKERSKMLKANEYDKMIRLALPREDNIHERAYPYINRQKEQINLSVDAVVEDMRGNVVRAYQVKGVSHKQYGRLQQQHEEDQRRYIYLPQRIDLRFLDDYPPVSDGVDLRNPKTASK